MRRVFGALVEDVLATSRALIAEVDPHSAEDVRRAGRPMIRFSAPVWGDLSVMRRFLFDRVYRAPTVMEMRANVTRVVDDLFPLYMARPDLLPAPWQGAVAGADGETALARLVSDYISGMTDRFALSEHTRLIASP